ncbi:MAG: hemolysin family protein [Gammaproteobacteria bacterium]|nr:hemolysin family protein [Gammaproteobacteria bacterium]MBT8445059.1 hemolysin family protein [Gammaproteobacteria bacterium]NND36904.1 HlyC/CorC family transporter [Gammaproteobacteria bacterium]
MLLLVTYVLIALIFSFLCSIAEAVILSVTPAYVALLEKEGKPVGSLLREQVENINRPLAAILTLNTIAHTIGAAGAGAQAAVVFGSGYVGVASAILTLLILIFSEIIPKTLGATYWKQLGPAVAYGLRVLVWALYPFVKLSQAFMRHGAEGPRLSGFSRREFAAMAELSASEGQLGSQEARMLQSLLRLRSTRVGDAMTPRTVVFSLPQDMTIATFHEQHESVRFSRIPVFEEDKDDVTGFVLRHDLVVAQARGENDRPLEDFGRDIEALTERMTLSQALREFQRVRAQIMLVVDEYGGVDGILTMEDIVETLLGLEIVDETDGVEDMRDVARRLAKHRARERAIKPGHGSQ